MLELKNISAGYSDKKVLDNVSLRFELQKIHGLVGGNGSGKTTFFNTLYRFIGNYGGFSTGKLLLDSKPLQKSDIAYMMSDNYFYPLITGREYLSIVGSNNSESLEFAEIMDLPTNDFIDTYSSGMKKKLVLAGMMNLDRRIYLFDEPYNEMDVEGVYILNRILQKLKEKGKTVFISSHIFGALKEVCDTFYYLKAGYLHKIKEVEDISRLNEHNKKYDEFIDRI